ncbi:MAG: hypothetical protein K8J31_02815 [Anaerolineae bacterium]|nr:hypothetical protein [Anaerolineae bacterium]
MHRRVLLCLALLVLLAAACQGPPPTQIILVVTATPLEQTADQTAEPQAAMTAEATATDEPTTVPATPTPAVSPTTDSIPTPTVTQIQAAEQVFEHGRMFWLQPTGQIWVMIVEGEGKGEWRIYEDTYVDSEPEFDPDITPPDGLDQPRRGFGKLWRDNPDIREALGWAITPEFGFVTRYEYHPGGTIDTPEPGYHVLSSLYEEQFRFNEADQTWQLN